MSKTEFTKGEWSVEDGRVVVCGDFKIAYSYSGSSAPFIEHIKANAHLIAAAPEMYEMLNRWVNSVECVDDNYQEGLKEETMDLLAKARGEKC